MHPGRRVTGRLDLVPTSDGPIVMTYEEWDLL